MKKLLVILLLGVIIQSHAQIKVGRAILDYSVKSYGETLKMNGAGDRSVFFIELYSAALYTQKKSKDPIKICFADETMSLKIVITSRLTDRETFVESIAEDFERVTGGNLGPLKSKLDKTLQIISEPIIKNDIFDFAYEQSVGTHIIKNGKELGVIEGQDFKFALFKIWLGEEPVNDKLKKEMLGVY